MILLRRTALSVILLIFGFIGKADAEIVVTPGPSVSLNVVPFGGTDDVRYQQVYDSSLFTNAGVTGRIKIIGFGFSPDHTGTYTADVSIGLNQTQTAVGALSTNLDDNITGSITTVFDDPTFSQSVIGGDLTYTLRFNFPSSPFIYNPATGDNLLMDISVADKPGGWAAYRGDGQGVTSRATSTVALDNGLRTLIEYQAVPEPSSLALLCIGITTALAGRRRRDN